MIPMNRDTHNDKNLPASSSFRWSLPLQALFQEGKDALQVLRLSSSNSNNKDDDGDHTADPLVDDENWARMKTLLLTYNKNKNHGLLGRHPGNNINSKQCAKILETVFDSLMKQRWQYRSSDRSNADAILTVDFPNDNVTKNMAHFWTVGIQKTWVVWSQQHRQTTRDPDDVWLEESFSGGTLGLLCSLKDPLLLLPRAATVDSILDVPEILQRAVVAPSNNTVGATRKNYSLPELPLPTAELWKFLYVHFVCTAVIRQQYPEEEEDGIAATPPLSVTDWKQRVEMCIDRQLRNSPVGKAAMALALMDWYLEKRLSISNREDKSNSEYYTDDNDAGKEGFPDDLTWAVVWEHLVGNTHK